MSDMSWWNDGWYDDNVDNEDIDGTDDRQRCEMDLTRTQVCLTVLDGKGNCPNARHHLRSTE